MATISRRTSQFLRRGAVDVTVTFGQPIPYDGDRSSAVAREIECTCAGSPPPPCASATLEMVT
jgi:hypothetical protein